MVVCRYFDNSFLTFMKVCRVVSLSLLFTLKNNWASVCKRFVQDQKPGSGENRVHTLIYWYKVSFITALSPWCQVCEQGAMLEVAPETRSRFFNRTIREGLLNIKTAKKLCDSHPRPRLPLPRRHPWQIGRQEFVELWSLQNQAGWFRRPWP